MVFYYVLLGDIIERVRITKGTMKLPPSPEIPLIAIGPGKFDFCLFLHQ